MALLGILLGKLDGIFVGVAVFAVFGILLGKLDGNNDGSEVGSAVPNNIG